MSDDHLAIEYDKIFEDDKLGIKSSVIDFAHLIEQNTYIEGGVSKVYSISADFGTGKTFFCEKLKSVLEKDGVQTTIMNIWEMDFYEDPLMPILAKLNEIYEKDGRKLPTKIIDSTLKFSKNSLAFLCGTAIKSISQKKLKVDIIEEFKKHFSSKSLYDDFRQYQKALKELKKALTKWAKSSDKPIIIIIDELDRCSPDYAVRTLEVLKHFFDVSGFVFVLAIDENHLESSVKCLFGTENFEGYKRKFINNTFLLPHPDKKAFAEFLYDRSGIDTVIKKIQEEKRELVFLIDIYNVFRCSFSYSRYGDGAEEIEAKKYNVLQTSESIIKRYFAAYSIWFKFSLRQMEQVFDRLTIFIKQIASGHELFSPDLAVFLVCLHEFDVKVYDALCHSDETYVHPITNMNKSDPGVFYFTKQIYGDSVHEMLNQIDRSITPELLEIGSFSYFFLDEDINEKIFIKDNIDRFFYADAQIWLYEQYAINTQNVLTPKTNFNLEKFKQNYFDKMDFLSHFE